MYTTIPEGEDPSNLCNLVKLIELSVAAADDRPVSDIGRFANRQPKSGYWYRAIQKRGEPPVDESGRFAFCAFPASYRPQDSGAQYTYIIDEDNTVFKADLGHGRGIEVFPDDEELRKNWGKMD